MKKKKRPKGVRRHRMLKKPISGGELEFKTYRIVQKMSKEKEKGLTGLITINGKDIYFKGKGFTRGDARNLVENLIDMYNLKMVVRYE